MFYVVLIRGQLIYNVMCKRKNCINYFGIIIALFLLSSTVNAAGWSDIAFYKKAQNKNEHVFEKNMARQISYEVNIKYPSTEILSFYKRLFSTKWNICKGKEQWESFGDLSDNSPLFIHQLVKYWVSHTENRLMMLSIRYESEGTAFREHPDMNTQKVFIVEYKESNLTRLLNALGLEC